MPSERMSTGPADTTITTVKQTPQRSQRQSQGRPLREYGPTRTAGKVVADVGLLEVEFLACLGLLVLLLFTNTSDTYANRVMSLMKRGTLLSILFFVLALVAASGANAAKIAKGIGAMVFVATLLTSPSGTIFTALDNFFKADWAGSTETSTGASGSADAGTASGTSDSPASVIAGAGITGALGGGTKGVTQVITSSPAATQIGIDVGAAQQAISDITLPGFGSTSALGSTVASNDFLTNIGTKVGSAIQNALSKLGLLWEKMTSLP